MPSPTARISFTLPADLPDAAYDALREALREQAGVRSVAIAPTEARLELRFDPARLPLRQALALALAVGVPLETRIREAALRVPGVGCPPSVALLERRLRNVAGVRWASVNAATGAALVLYDGELHDERTLRAAVEGAVGPPAAPLPPWSRDLPLVSAALCGLLLLAGVWAQAQSVLGHDGRVAVFAAAYVAGGWPLVRASWRTLRAIGADGTLLVTLAAIAAAVVERWREGAVVVFVAVLAAAIQPRLLARARPMTRRLDRLRASEAMLAPPGEPERVVPASDLEPGNTIRLRPGEIIPADLEIVEGFTHVDESELLGPGEPERRSPGDPIFAGARIVDGSPLARVTRTGEETRLERLRAALAEAEARESPLQAGLAQFAQVYALLALLAAIGVATIPPALFGHAWRSALLQASVLLVAASPVALLAAAPTAALAAIHHLLRHGILARSGAAVETLAVTPAMALDRSGALSRRRPEVREVRAAASATEAEVLRVAASVEALSKHPVAQAIVRHARRRSLEPLPAIGMQAFAGRGVQAEVAGQLVFLGGDAWAAEHDLAPPEELAAPAARARRRGQRVLWLFVDEIVGYLAVDDPLRDECRAALDALDRLGVRRTVMLTGDHAETAAAVAEQAGVHESRAELTAEAQVAAVAALQTEYGLLAVVGDPATDAATMARAQVSIGITGDGGEITLLREDLRLAAYAVAVARWARRVTRASLSLAAVTLGGLVAATFVADLALGWAALIQHGVALLASAIGLAALRRPPRLPRDRA